MATLFIQLAQKVWPLMQTMLLQLDRESFQKLDAYQGKIVCFEIDGFQPIYLQIQEQGFDIVVEEHIIPNLTFSGRFFDFVTLIFAKNQPHRKPQLHIKGDIDFAKVLYDTFTQLDLDWENFLAHYFGDNAAVLMTRVFSQLRQWGKEQTYDRMQDLTRYLQDEQELLPTQEQIQTFLQQVDILKHDTARLEARMIQLANQLPSREH